MTGPPRIGIVAIGRNEGERLRACLRSLPPGCPAVYVDSGSTDDSVAFARSLGVAVVELDMSIPFTAARARNAGLEALLAQGEAPDFIQMIDGDCMIDAGWIAAALAAFETDPRLAVAFGRRRELHPDRSAYNRMCDHEWDVPVGEALSCGGDALFRLAPLQAAGGYDPTLIAGEEPDLCARLRAAGHRIRRIDAEMTLHDAAMTSFGQYWRRAKRSGHAYAELAWRGKGTADPLWSRQVRSIIAWALVLPLLILCALAVGLLINPLGLIAAALLLLVYPLQILRIAVRKRALGWRFALVSAALLVIGKFAELRGVLLYHMRRLSGRSARIIEYKTGGGPS